jgi:hypothetical protein
MKAWGLSIAGVFFNANSAFDTLEHARFASIITSSPTSQKIAVIVKLRSEVASACLMLKSINAASLVNALLPG